MATGLKKPKQARVYLNEENQAMLEDLTRRLVDLSESQVVTLLLSASLRAVKSNNNQMPLPLVFKIENGGGIKK